MGIRLNHVIIGGTVGRDPEVKTTSTGKTVATFSIACDTGKDKESDWFDVTAWEQQAEVVSKYVSKGSSVVISGRLSQNKWEDKDGNKRSRVMITVNNINLVGGKKKENGGGGNAVMSDDDIPF